MAVTWIPNKIYKFVELPNAWSWSFWYSSRFFRLRFSWLNLPKLSWLMVSAWDVPSKPAIIWALLEFFICKRYSSSSFVRLNWIGHLITGRYKPHWAVSPAVCCPKWVADAPALFPHPSSLHCQFTNMHNTSLPNLESSSCTCCFRRLIFFT